MPVTACRANNLVKRGRAMFIKDKVLGTYLKLLKKPSGFKTQKLVLGIDYGTLWNGFSVVGENNVSFNYEYENGGKLKSKSFIKSKTKDRAEARRFRRVHL